MFYFSSDKIRGISFKSCIFIRIEKFNSLSVTFKQVIKSKEAGKVFIEAVFDVVAISNAGKLYRRMPAELVECFEKAVKDDEKSLVTC